MTEVLIYSVMTFVCICVLLSGLRSDAETEQFLREYERQSRLKHARTQRRIDEIIERNRSRQGQ